jgi:hypothetical protein
MGSRMRTTAILLSLMVLAACIRPEQQAIQQEQNIDRYDYSPWPCMRKAWFSSEY